MVLLKPRPLLKIRWLALSFIRADPCREKGCYSPWNVQASIHTSSMLTTPTRQLVWYRFTRHHFSTGVCTHVTRFSCCLLVLYVTTLIYYHNDYEHADMQHVVLFTAWLENLEHDSSALLLWKNYLRVESFEAEPSCGDLML